MTRTTPAAATVTGTVGVVGAGTMGAGIAQVAAAAGHQVVLFDTAPGAAEAAADRVRRRVDRLAASGKTDLGGGDLQLTTADDLAELAGAGLVIEAVVEDLTVKRQVFSALEHVVGDACLLASNTSSLSPTALGAALRQPRRLLGLHFFNPVPAMALVEVVPGLATDPAAVEAAAALVRSWGKTVVVSTASPGFIVNRVARPFYAEAWRVVGEQAAAATTVDAVLTRGAGFRMGPFALMDLIGHDVNLAVSRQVWTAFGHDPRFEPSLGQQALVDAGWLGRKTGRGVYDHGDDRRPPDPKASPAAPAPARVVEHGRSGLGHLLARSEVTVERASSGAAGPDRSVAPGIAGWEVAGAASVDDAAPGWVELPAGARLMLSHGTTAAAAAARQRRPVVVVDRTAEEASATCVAVSDGCPPAAAAEAVGLLQAAGLDVFEVGDTPGLIATRTVAMLVNLAVDALGAGVASAADIDTAMQLGTNYPLGPLAWGDLWGPATVVAILDAMQAVYADGRYRPSPLLRRRALTGRPLAEEIP